MFIQLRSIEHVRKDQLRSIEHVCQDQLRSIEHVCKEQLRSIQHVCKEQLRSTEHVRKEQLRSIQHVCKEQLCSIQHVCKEQLRSTFARGKRRKTKICVACRRKCSMWRISRGHLSPRLQKKDLRYPSHVPKLASRISRTRDISDENKYRIADV